ncbi:hypothetical protein PROFUN_09074 [Planoprotostelium fungivorum]|uniref:U1 small nuclear ribonucleoprotein 70 kDa n=1 Tax=Planoprotostelium fungivorum TaxID=1890364 RepID=A0A2P6NIH8_9EUKA|nr:hypothetical protein PROFUN_09074 [Planoprotostelium fungivorum]
MNQPGLPPNLMIMFSPRPRLAFIPAEKEKAPLPPYSGVSDYMSFFENPAEVPPMAPQYPFETRRARKQRMNQSRLNAHKEKLVELAKSWEPAKDPNATGDPYKTIFVGRLSYQTTEYKLKREFESYGPIKKVRVVMDTNGKPRGYGFIEYEKEKDVKSAYRSADGKKIDEKRVVVDVERGRTDRSWRPRRLGGGLGFTRRGAKEVNQSFSGSHHLTTTPAAWQTTEAETTEAETTEAETTETGEITETIADEIIAMIAGEMIEEEMIETEEITEKRGGMTDTETIGEVNRETVTETKTGGTGDTER